MNKKYARLALVTGATSGIGEATVRRMVSAGFGVAGTGRRGELLHALEQELGESFCGITADICAPGAIDLIFDQFQARFNCTPDIVVANAGRGLGGSVKDVEIQEFESVFQVNVSATLALLQCAMGSMEPQQQKHFPQQAADIVVIGSVVGRNISPFSAAYGATKFAVHALTEGLRREAGKCGVRVTLIEPGITISGFQDAAGYSQAMVDNFKEKFGPLLISDDVADAILYTVNLPPHVHVSELMLRPTRQDYP